MIYKMNFRVYYEDTDAMGIVYYANYFRFAERARTEMLREMGMSHEKMADLGGMGVMCHASISYRAPAKLDDLLRMETIVAEVGATSIKLHQVLYRDDTVLVEMDFVVVFVSKSLKPTRIPDELRNLLLKG